MTQNERPDFIPPNRRRFIESNYYEADLFLMVDDRLVEHAEGAKLTFCPFEKAAAPVIRPTELWEGGDGTHPSPIHQDPLCCTTLWDAEEECHLAWYRTSNRIQPPSHYVDRANRTLHPNWQREGSTLCLAKSKDGIHWEKPELGAVLFRGSYRNNMVPSAPKPVLQEHLSCVVPNYLDDGNPQLVCSTFSKFDDPIYPTGITSMHSDDGVHWKPHFPPVLPLDGDAHCLMWDPRLQCYLCTTRSAQHSRIMQRLRGRGLSEFKNKRHAALAKSTDLVHWTPMLDILETDQSDPENAEIYTLYILPYGNLYLGFMEMFYIADGMTRGNLETQLAVSYDLDHWHRVGGRKPILPHGTEGSWDASHVRIAFGTPFPEGDRLRVWYGGADVGHWQAGHAGVGTATLRRDGFACWSAGPEGGTVTTVALRTEWATWPQLNVDASDGEIRVEILKDDGQPLEGCSLEDCLPITGDHTRALVQFGPRRGNFIRHSGLIRYRFHLRNAKLYAFRSANTFLAKPLDSKIAEGNHWT